MHEPEPTTASYKQLASIRSTRSVAGRWSVLAATSFLGFIYAFAGLYAWLLGASFDPIIISPATIPGPLEMGALVILAILVIAIPHELLHGLVLTAFDGKPGYGVTLAYGVFPYAYVETRGSYTRNQMLVVLLTPFVVISLAGLATALATRSYWPLLLAAANGAGSTGDLWTACRLFAYPSSVRVGPTQTADGEAFGIYAREAVLPDRTFTAIVTGAVGTFTVVVTSLIALVFVSLAFDSGTVHLGDSDSWWFLLRHERHPSGQGAVLEVGSVAISVLSLLGGLAWAFLEGVGNE